MYPQRGGCQGALARMSKALKVKPKELKVKHKVQQDVLHRFPGLAGFCNGSWWKVEIVTHQFTDYYVKYVLPSGGVEETWLPQSCLRLLSRPIDDWDCNLLRDGMDVCVFGVHPDCMDSKDIQVSFYDARITHIKRVSHVDGDCKCRFQVRFYTIKRKEDPNGIRDPSGLASPRPLLTHSTATREVRIGELSILQQPGRLSFKEILGGHLAKSWPSHIVKRPSVRWTNDAYLLKGSNFSHHEHERDEWTWSSERGRGGERRVENGVGENGGVRRGKNVVERRGAEIPGPREAHQDLSDYDAREEAAIPPRIGELGSGGERRGENVVERRGAEIPGPREEHRDLSDYVAREKAAIPPRIVKCRSGVRRGAEVPGPCEEHQDLRVYQKATILPTIGKRGSGGERRGENGVERREDQIPGPWEEHQDLSDYDARQKATIPPRSGLDARKSKKTKKKKKIIIASSTEDEDSSSSEDEDLEVLPADNGNCSRGERDVDVKTKRTVTPPEAGTRGRRRPRTNKARLGKKAKPTQRPADKNPGTAASHKNSFAESKEINDGGNAKILDFKVGSSQKVKPSVVIDLDDDDCDVIEVNPNSKKGGPALTGITARSTQGAKGRPRKEKSAVDADKAGSGNHLIEGHDAPKVEILLPSRLRPRKLVKNEIQAGRGKVSARDRHTPPKQPIVEKETASKVYSRPLYLDLLGDDQKTEAEIGDGAGVIREEQPKCGVNAEWNPTSFRDVVPVCEEADEEAHVGDISINSFDDDCLVPEAEPKLEMTLEKETVTLQQQQDLAKENPRTEGETEEGLVCRAHDECLKEDVGLVCRHCGVVTSKIEFVMPFLDTWQSRTVGNLNDRDFGRRSPNMFQEICEYGQTQANSGGTWLTSYQLPIRMERSMHPHQKEGFEFLWRNFAHGEGKERRMKEDRNTGCILSHAPGTGKTFLVIAFLQSYMNQFADCRPLIVAPKIMLRQWEKEFSYWRSDIKVYILNTARDCGRRLVQIHEEAGVIKGKNSHLNIDTFRSAMLYEWKRQKGVLLVSYNLFSCLTDENRHYTSHEGVTIGQTLLEKPNLLVLDEGHFPRNRGTRIRQSLMRVKTNVRILLSGTLFQNNFEELFNTLYLVRPGFVEGFANFVEDSNRSDDDQLSRKISEMEQVTKAAESAARKLFVEEVGAKIEQGQRSEGLLQHGLERLGALTGDFVHHHAGEVLARLPGLRDFAILLKPTAQQCCLLELVEKSFNKRNQYLEREIAVSETSIHPILIRKLEFAKFLDTASIVKRFKEQKGEIGLLTSPEGSPGAGPTEVSNSGAKDPDEGVKTKFVFDLLRCCKPAKEKVLIFSQHLSPLELLEEMFLTQFDWHENVDYLKLHGKLSMEERAKIIWMFNNSSTDILVLLASTKACGEGINLTGASRVVFLDVLWNPAVIKQAMCRAFRLGQTKIVYVYRLIASGTVEENKYKKAIRKDWLSQSIFTSSKGINDEESGEAGKGDENGTNNLLAWEVDVTTCKDAMLETILGNDNSDTKTYLKVIEHSSNFRDQSIPCGPDAKGWLLEDLADSKALDSEEGLDPADDVDEVTALATLETIGVACEVDAPTTSDSDEEDLLSEVQF